MIHSNDDYSRSVRSVTQKTAKDRAKDANEVVMHFYYVTLHNRK